MKGNKRTNTSFQLIRMKFNREDLLVALEFLAAHDERSRIALKWITTVDLVQATELPSEPSTVT